MGQLLDLMEVGLEVWLVEHCLDYLLLLIAVEVWNLEEVVELEAYCRRLDYRLDTLLLGLVLLLNYWTLLLLFLVVHCRMD